VPPYFLEQHGHFRMRWDLFIIALVVYNCIELPLSLAFEYESTVQSVFYYLIDLCFLLDIVLNFRTSFTNPKTGIEEFDKRLVARNYVTHWRFWTDIISIIPFELIVDIFTDSSNKTLEVFALLKLIRLLRLGRIISYLKVRQDAKVGLRIAQLLCMVLLLVHWVACLWYMLIRDEGDWIPPKDLDSGTTEFYD